MARVKQLDEEKVLFKAMDLFWKKGYHATSIQDLVDYLGVNRASLYNTFGGKKELFSNAFRLYQENNVKAITEFLQKQPGTKAGLRSMFKNAISESVSDQERKGCFVVNATTELMPGDDLMRGVLLDNKSFFEKTFYDFLVKGEKNAEFAKGKDLKAIATLIYTLYSGLKVIAKIQPNGKKLMSSIDAALTILD